VSTSDAPPPSFTSVTGLCSACFRVMSAIDVLAAVRALPDKQCTSDPLHTAFETVVHVTLLRLEVSCGISGTLHTWLHHNLEVVGNTFAASPQSRRHRLRQEITANLVTAYVLQQLNYCNALLPELPASTLAPLQWVMHAAARLVCGLSPRDHVTSALRSLHWLPVKRGLNSSSACPSAIQ